MSGGDPESKVFVALWVVARKRGVGAATFDRLSRRHRMVVVNGPAQEIRIEFSTGRLRVHRSLLATFFPVIFGVEYRREELRDHRGKAAAWHFRHTKS